MPRSSGGRRSGGSSGGGGLFGRSSSSRPSAPPPAPAAAAPPPAPASGGGGIMSNMMGSMASGMATGVGFGVAQRALDSVFGGRQMEVVHTNAEAPVAAPNSAPMASAPQSYSAQRPNNSCTYEAEELNRCIAENSDISHCQHLVDNLKACRGNFV